MTTTEPRSNDPSDSSSRRPHRNTRGRRAVAAIRNTWRGLTSMRTALILLFLLALAALPGAFLPQEAVDPNKVAQYLDEHGWWAQVLHTLQFFSVYSSVWFSAIYLLLMISLIGCLMPRSRDYIRAIRAKPVRTPRNLGRLPHHARANVAADTDEVLATARTRLRGWRRAEYEHEDGSHSISAERGFLRETGNLVFHFALLGIIIAFAVGKMYAYEGQTIVIADGSQFCNSGILAYDNFEPGLQVDGTSLPPFCVKVNDFEATYTTKGQPIDFESNIGYQDADSLGSGSWQPYHLAVNDPLRLESNRIYLLGHGYAPTFTVRFPNGEVRTQTIQWKPTNKGTLLSQGTTKFLPPDTSDPWERRNNQLAVTGLFAPTAAMHGKVLSSAGPRLQDPAVAVDVYQGDLGDSESIFTVDQEMIEQGRLNKVARQNLDMGESLTLDDGTEIEFSGVEQFVSLQVSHNPTQLWMLVFAIALLSGLITSLVIKRRRIWVRVTPADDAESGRHTVVEVGGLARTDQAGYGEEFTRIAERITGTGEKDY